MVKKQPSKNQPAKIDFGFFRRPAGYFFTTAALWVVGYILASLAIDSGSLLQWGTAVLALGWGLVRLIQGIILSIKKK